MKENTKKYIEDMLWWFEVQTNTLNFELNEIIKTRRKMQKFYKKIIKNF
jgi:hypothetical protein